MVNSFNTGSKGSLGIDLSRKIIPEYLTLEHAAPNSLYADGLKSSARDVQVYAFYENQSPKMLSAFQFNATVENVKIVELNPSEPTSTIMVKILNNWGNKDWTCIYKVRVYGKEQI
jgi:hypothetical protein